MYAENDKAREVEILEKQVIVRIWTSSSNVELPGVGIGHVSIEIPSNSKYISLWPDCTQPKDKSDSPDEMPENSDEDSDEDSDDEIAVNTKEFFFSGVNCKELSSVDYGHDLLEKDDNHPNFICCFYNLDTKKILKAFASVCEQTNQQSYSVLPLTEATANCASFVFRLLKLGDLSDIYNTIDNTICDLENSSLASAIVSQGIWKGDYSNRLFHAAELLASPIIKSPDSLITILKKAKNNEIIKFEQELHLLPKFDKEYRGEPSIESIIALAPKSVADLQM